MQSKRSKLQSHVSGFMAQSCNLVSKCTTQLPMFDLNAHKKDDTMIYSMKNHCIMLFIKSFRGFNPYNIKTKTWVNSEKTTDILISNKLDRALLLNDELFILSRNDKLFLYDISDVSQIEYINCHTLTKGNMNGYSSHGISLIKQNNAKKKYTILLFGNKNNPNIPFTSSILKITITIGDIDITISEKQIDNFQSDLAISDDDNKNSNEENKSNTNNNQCFCDFSFNYQILKNCRQERIIVIIQRNEIYLLNYDKRSFSKISQNGSLNNCLNYHNSNISNNNIQSCYFRISTFIHENTFYGFDKETQAMFVLPSNVYNQSVNTDNTTTNNNNNLHLSSDLNESRQNMTTTTATAIKKEIKQELDITIIKREKKTKIKLEEEMKIEAHTCKQSTQKKERKRTEKHTHKTKNETKQDIELETQESQTIVKNEFIDRDSKPNNNYSLNWNTNRGMFRERSRAASRSRCNFADFDNGGGYNYNYGDYRYGNINFNNYNIYSNETIISTIDQENKSDPGNVGNFSNDMRNRESTSVTKNALTIPKKIFLISAKGTRLVDPKQVSISCAGVNARRPIATGNTNTSTNRNTNGLINRDVFDPFPLIMNNSVNSNFGQPISTSQHNNTIQIAPNEQNTPMINIDSNSNCNDSKNNNDCIETARYNTLDIAIGNCNASLADESQQANVKQKKFENNSIVKKEIRNESSKKDNDNHSKTNKTAMVIETAEDAIDSVDMCPTSNFNHVNVRTVKFGLLKDIINRKCKIKDKQFDFIDHNDASGVYYKSIIEEYLYKNGELNENPLIKTKSGWFPRSSVIKKYKLTKQQRVESLNGPYGIKSEKSLSEGVCIGQFNGFELSPIEKNELLTNTCDEWYHSLYSFTVPFANNLKSVLGIKTNINISKNTTVKDDHEQCEMNDIIDAKSENVEEPAKKRQKLSSSASNCNNSNDCTRRGHDMDNCQNTNQDGMNNDGLYQRLFGSMKEELILDTVALGFGEGIPDYAILSWINDCRKNIYLKNLTNDDNNHLNCIFVTGLVNGWPSVFLVTTKTIEKNVQLLTDYGKDYSDTLAQESEYVGPREM